MHRGGFGTDPSLISYGLGTYNPYRSISWVDVKVSRSFGASGIWYPAEECRDLMCGV